MDNTGHYRDLDKGVSAPFIEQFTTSFSIGVIVYYNPAFQMVDDVGDPLPNAQVYVQWPNGTSDVLPRYTSVDGFLNFTGLPSATYGFTVLWKDVLVKQTTVDVNSNGPYVIKTEVYRLSVEVLGNDAKAVNGAYVIAYTQTGLGYGFAITNETGLAVFKLPKGTYDIEAHYSGVYWLSGVTAMANKTNIALDASKSVTLTMTQVPPPIWTTIGFWLIVIAIVAAVLVAIVIYKLLVRSRRA